MTKRGSTYGDMANRDLAEGLGYPGIDPREWISYGIVDPDGEGDDAKSTVFDPDYGPLINVTLHPSGTPVVCRVASSLAGNGEGEWAPFIGKDEVLVALAGGSERQCVIIGRLNQGTDGFPTMVGGVDTSKNAIGFRRIRAPYVIELGGAEVGKLSSYMITQAVTNSSLLLDKGGNWYIKDGEGTALHIGPDWFGFQTIQSEYLIQMQLESKRLFISVDSGAAAMTLSADPAVPSLIMSAGQLALGTNAHQPVWHGISAESVCMLLDKVLFGLAAFSAPGALAGLTAGSGAVVAAAIGQASTMVLNPLIATAVTGAMQAPPKPPPDSPATQFPGALLPGLLLG